MTVYDIAIVGAGPSGAAAALTAHRLGLSVVVVDKAMFPRDKTCGDGLTTNALRLLEGLGLDLGRLDGLKGKKIGIAMGTGSEIFWRRVVEKRGYKVADFTMVNVEAPEMLAATERGDIDGFAVWEPWPTRTLMAVKGTKIVQTAEGIYNNVNFVYMNRGWIDQNRASAEKFVRALIEANDVIGKDRPAAAKMVAKFLKMPLELASELMPKVEFDMDWQARSIESIQVAEKQLADQKKLKAPLDYAKYCYLDLVRAVRPANIKIAALPK